MPVNLAFLQLSAKIIAPKSSDIHHKVIVKVTLKNPLNTSFMFHQHLLWRISVNNMRSVAKDHDSVAMFSKPATRSIVPFSPLVMMRWVWTMKLVQKIVKDIVWISEWGDGGIAIRCPNKGDNGWISRVKRKSSDGSLCFGGRLFMCLCVPLCGFMGFYVTVWLYVLVYAFHWCGICVI